MDALVADMMQEDPSKRPTIDVALAQFEQIVKGLTDSHLQSRARPRGEPSFDGLLNDISHWSRRVGFTSSEHLTTL